VPRKNLAFVAGETLLARAVRCAQESQIFDLIVVSTDDAEIAEEGRRAGAAVPFLRPPDLATSTAAVADAARYTLAKLAESGFGRFDIVALLEPTSPLRTPQIVRQVVEAAEQSGVDAALSLSPVPLRFHAAKQFRLGGHGHIQHVAASGAQVVNRQELETTYVRNGMCYAVRTAALEQGLGFLGSAARGVVVEGEIVNIDEPADLELARRLLEPHRRAVQSLPAERSEPAEVKRRS
jgi:CMP-N-acetylneuraminic acid synthetase